MIVSVHALFSTSNKIGSHIIAKGSHHLAKDVPECSHIAVLVNRRWVHESTMKTGVQVISYDKWKMLHTEVDRVKIDDMEYQIVADCFRDMLKKKYDWPGIVFFVLVIPFTLIGFKMPKRNLLENKNKYFCCEVLGSLKKAYYSMMAPCQILRSLKCQ